MRGVRLISFEVKVHTDLRDLHSLEKLDVNKVGLLPIGLPECIDVVVSKLINSVALFGGGKGPNG